ncbi:hypothetical protein [Phascolarctobacterium succinatutens]|uniref:hypothetical protein n=1 Tax=Phascolarctobacterium succinatutens TaxID=626940 RepID=UPI003AB89CA4
MRIALYDKGHLLVSKGMTFIFFAQKEKASTPTDFFFKSWSNRKFKNGIKVTNKSAPTLADMVE